MDFTKQYNIQNLPLINRLLPFFARGWKIVSFIYSVSSPIIKTHTNWLAWAQERLIEAKIPFQASPMEWYLNHLFSQYFYTADQTFSINRFAHYKNYQTIPSISDDVEGDIPMSYSVSETAGDDQLYINTHNEVAAETKHRFNVAAPKLKSDTITNEQYVAEVRKIIDKYTCTKKYQVFIMDY